MSTLLTDFVPVTSLLAGQSIRYGGGDYVVAEVLPIAVLSGHAVIAYAGENVDERVVLVFAIQDALAELSDVRAPRCAA